MQVAEGGIEDDTTAIEDAAAIAALLTTGEAVDEIAAGVEVGTNDVDRTVEL